MNRSPTFEPFEVRRVSRRNGITVFSGRVIVLPEIGVSRRGGSTSFRIVGLAATPVVVMATVRDSASQSTLASRDSLVNRSGTMVRPFLRTAGVSKLTGFPPT